jgi:hypothetical protein
MKKINRPSAFVTYSNYIDILFNVSRTTNGGVQGCQMAYFQTKNPNVGKIWRALQWRMLAYFMPIWSILRPFGLFYGHLVYFTAIWYILLSFGIFCCHLVYAKVLWYIYFSPFGMLYQEKSGNPGVVGTNVLDKNS